MRRYGARVDPQHQVIRVDGLRIPSRQDLVYLALNKPAGVLTTMSDDRGRRTVGDLLGDRQERLYHVGRLDYETEGLMLFTNDGDLAHRLMHPKYGVLKTYLADVPGPVDRDLGRRLMTGIELEDGVASADKFRVVERAGSRALVEITLHEGRKHIVRRLLAAVGHPVTPVGADSGGAGETGEPEAWDVPGTDYYGSRGAVRGGGAVGRLWSAGRVGPCGGRAPQMRRWLGSPSRRVRSLARGAWGGWRARATLRQRRTGGTSLRGARTLVALLPAGRECRTTEAPLRGDQA